MLLPVHSEEPAQAADPSAEIKNTPIRSPADKILVDEPGIIMVWLVPVFMVSKLI